MEFLWEKLNKKNKCLAVIVGLMGALSLFEPNPLWFLPLLLSYLGVRFFMEDSSE